MTAPIIKLSQLAAASALTGAEAVPVVQGGVTKKTTSAALIPVPVTKFVFDTSNTTMPAAGEMATLAASLVRLLMERARLTLCSS